MSPKPGLPIDPTRFVGREADLARLAAWLRGPAAWVTLCGPAGTGKTRLARHFAALPATHAQVDGAWFCDLGDTRTRDDVVAAVGRALGVALTLGKTADDSRDQVGHAIAGRGRVLLVLDNFEQVAAHAAETLGRWVVVAPAARFVVTSREPLGLAGEVRHELAPLAEAEAVALFEDRARAAHASFALRPGEDAIVAEIVRRLDGLPLAIELAAARTEVMSVPQVLARLSRRFELLRGDRRDVAARHATLRNALDWSWELLSPWEQDALAQSAAFHGGFTLEAAEAVIRLAETAPPVLDALHALRRRSLVRLDDGRGPDGAAQLGLYESVREYAAEMLALRGARGAVEARHAAYYLALAEAAAGPSAATREEDALHALAAVRSQLLAALRRTLPTDPETAARLALAMDGLFATRGPFDAHHELLDDAVAAAERAGDAVLLARALRARGECRRVRGRNADALADLHAALAGARQCASAFDEAEALRGIGGVLQQQGRPDAAREHLQRALEIHRAAGQRRWQGAALCDLGTLSRYLGRAEEAREYYRQALAIHNALHDRRREGVVLGHLGALAHKEGRLDEARAHYAAALAIHREIGDRRHEAVALGYLGLVPHEQGRLDEARPYYEQALALHRTVGDRRFEGIVQSYMASLLCERGDADAAWPWFERALAIHAEVGDRRFEGFTLGCLGNRLLEAGHAEQARSCLTRAVVLCREVGDVGLEGLALASLAALDAALGATAPAEAGLALALARIRVAGEPWLVAAYEVLAGVLDVAHARAAAATEGPRAAAPHLARARQRLTEAQARGAGEGGAGPVPSVDVRTAMVVLRRVLVEAEAAAAATALEPAKETAGARVLEVGPEGRWFATPGGARVDLARRRALRLIMLHLADARATAPDHGQSWRALLAAGWPGERMIEQAGADRVYTAVGTLRKMGLHDMLLTRDDGYLLDPAVVVRRSAEP